MSRKRRGTNLSVLEDKQVGVIVFVEEIEVESDGHFAREDLLEVDENVIRGLSGQGQEAK